MLKRERGAGVINLRSMKKQNLPYIMIWIIYYAWVISYTTWWTSPSSEIGTAFGAEFRSLVHIVNLLSSAACVFIFKKKWFATTARIGAAAVVVCLGMYFAAPLPQLKTIFTVLLGMSLGCVNISILIPFTFILNNTEKLLCVVVSHALSNVITLIADGRAIHGAGETVAAAGILIISLTAVLFFRSSDLKTPAEDKLITNKSVRPAAVLTLLASTAGAVLFLGAGKAALNTYLFLSGHSTPASYYIGGIIGCMVYVLIFILMKNSIYMTLTIPFGCLALGFVCYSLSDQAQYLGIIFGLLLGAGTSTGMSTVYYVLGIIGKKYNSMLYLRLSIGIIGICGGISGVLLGNTVANMPQLTLTVSIASILAVVTILIFSPVISRICFDENWAGDLTLAEITALKQAMKMLEEPDFVTAEPFGSISNIMTEDEIKVALLLIEGNTRSDILRKLHITAAAAGQHENAIRKKLLTMSDPDHAIAAIITEYKLTKRETDMLRYLQSGLTNAAMAEELFLSEETVKIHIRNLMKKLPVNNRSEVAEWMKAFAANQQ